MDMGAMVDVPHACDQEVDASTKKGCDFAMAEQHA
jgi:hypothetical protein